MSGASVMPRYCSRAFWFTALILAAAIYVPNSAFAQASAPLWWCVPLRQYYPTVQTCPVPWRQVAKTPPKPKRGVPPALPGRQQKFDILGSPIEETPNCEPPSTRRGVPIDG